MPIVTADALTRPRFFDRQPLQASDMNAILDYFRESSRRHNRAVVGSGVACGLAVTRVQGEAWQIKVGPGHAILPSGDEVTLPSDSDAYDICAEARACLGIGTGCVNPQAMTAPVGAAAGEATPSRRFDFSTLVTPSTVLTNRQVASWLKVYTLRGQGGAATFQDARGSKIGTMNGLAATERLVLEFDADVSAAEVELAFATPTAMPHLVAETASGVVVDGKSPAFAHGQRGTVHLRGTGIRRVIITSNGADALIMAAAVPDAPRGRVWLALFSGEHFSGYQPALPARCEQPNGALEPARVCEAGRLAILCSLPDHAIIATCADVHNRICADGLRSCPPVPAQGEDCVILAEIGIGDSGITSVDAIGPRRQLLPLALLSDAARCSCGTVVEVPPTPAPTPTPTPTPFTIFSPPPTFFTLFSFEPTTFTTFTDFSLFTLGPTNFSLFTELFTIPFGVDTLPGREVTLPGDVILPGEVVLPGEVISGLPGENSLSGVSVLPGETTIPDVVFIDPGTDAVVNDILNVTGIGATYATRLKDSGVATTQDFLLRAPQELSQIMGVSEVRVAEMQLNARGLMRGKGPG